MKLTAGYIYDAEQAVTELLETIPDANATWAVREYSDGYSYVSLELLLIYGSTFRWDYLREDNQEDCSLEEFINKWKQYVEEAIQTTPVPYRGDALRIDSAIEKLTCDIAEDKLIDESLIAELIVIRDKLHDKHS